MKANPGLLRRKAARLGFDRMQTDRLVKERPDDLAGWAELGHVPPAEEQPTKPARERRHVPPAEERPPKPAGETGKGDVVPKPRKRP